MTPELALNIVATILALWQFQWMESTFRMFCEDQRVLANWRSGLMFVVSAVLILLAVWL